tara:strand:- start:19311 stop:20279 length:969 start_codon:yes stop_codon:yes gene_type:complete
MKILYIDNKNYIHNADLHIEFISSLESNGFFNIVGYGDGSIKNLKTYIRINKNIPTQLQEIINKYKPNAILTYSSGSNIPELYKWISDELSKVDIPKFHIATDYLRDGFIDERAKWFEYIGYSMVAFRHKTSFDYPLGVKKSLLPLSIDKNLYLSNITKNIKKQKVGFIGTSSKFPDLYVNRIMAMNALRKKNLLIETKYLKEVNRSQMMFGEHYVKFLTNNLLNLTCGGTCNYFTAKHLQIPAAYSMLICTDIAELEYFPEDTYIKYNINNLDKLISDVLFHIENPKITEEKINILHNFVINNHSNYKRGLELVKIMKDVL